MKDAAGFDIPAGGGWSLKRLKVARCCPARGVVEPLASIVDVEEPSVASVAPIDTPITSLTFHAFELLTPAQIPLLTPAQVATIPDAYWMSRIPAASRAAFTLPQIQALRVAAVRIDLLTPQQVNWLTANHIHSLSHYDFPHLAPNQVPTLTTAEIASIPDSGTFTEWSAAARASLTVPQVQALRVATVRLHLLTPQQVSWLTTAQIQSLDRFDFKFLNAAQTPLLTQTQIATIPDIGSFGAWSGAARAALTPGAGASLARGRRAAAAVDADAGELAERRPNTVVALLRFSLSDGRSDAAVDDVADCLDPRHRFIRGMVDGGAGSTDAAAGPGAQCRGRLHPVVDCPANGWLTAAQVRALPQHQFRYLPASHTPLLTPAQVATIPDVGAFSMWSAAAGRSLIPTQVQALDVADVRLILLTPTQINWLTAAQIQSLRHHDFYLLNSGANAAVNRGAAYCNDSEHRLIWRLVGGVHGRRLTAAQVQALNVATVYIELLTDHQRAWLSAAQVRSLPPHQLEHLPATQVPVLTVEQVASIASLGAFNDWSSSARGALTFTQVQNLNVEALGIELLNVQQIGWLTPAQVRSLAYQQFRHLHPHQIPLLTTAANRLDAGRRPDRHVVGRSAGRAFILPGAGAVG